MAKNPFGRMWTPPDAEQLSMWGVGPKGDARLEQFAKAVKKLFKAVSQAKVENRQEVLNKGFRSLAAGWSLSGMQGVNHVLSSVKGQLQDLVDVSVGKKAASDVPMTDERKRKIREKVKKEREEYKKKRAKKVQQLKKKVTKQEPKQKKADAVAQKFEANLPKTDEQTKRAIRMLEAKRPRDPETGAFISQKAASEKLALLRKRQGGKTRVAGAMRAADGTLVSRKNMKSAASKHPALAGGGAATASVAAALQRAKGDAAVKAARQQKARNRIVNRMVSDARKTMQKTDQAKKQSQEKFLAATGAKPRKATKPKAVGPGKGENPLTLIIMRMLGLAPEKGAAKGAKKMPVNLAGLTGKPRGAFPGERPLPASPAAAGPLTLAALAGRGGSATAGGAAGGAAGGGAGAGAKGLMGLMKAHPVGSAIGAGILGALLLNMIFGKTVEEPVKARLQGEQMLAAQPPPELAALQGQIPGQARENQMLQQMMLAQMLGGGSGLTQFEQAI